MENRNENFLELLSTIFEDIDNATRRHPLLVGFAHGPASRKEIEDRLKDISDYAKIGMDLIKNH